MKLRELVAKIGEAYQEGINYTSIRDYMEDRPIQGDLLKNKQVNFENHPIGKIPSRQTMMNLARKKPPNVVNDVFKLANYTANRVIKTINALIGLGHGKRIEESPHDQEIPCDDYFLSRVLNPDLNQYQYVFRNLNNEEVIEVHKPRRGSATEILMYNDDELFAHDMNSPKDPEGMIEHEQDFYFDESRTFRKNLRPSLSLVT